MNEIGSLSVTFQGGFRYRSDSGEGGDRRSPEREKDSEAAASSTNSNCNCGSILRCHVRSDTSRRRPVPVDPESHRPSKYVSAGGAISGDTAIAPAEQELGSAQRRCHRCSEFHLYRSRSEGDVNIPIIFFSNADPLGSGHVVSVAQPGGNITGISLMMTETDVKVSWSCSRTSWCGSLAAQRAHSSRRGR